MSTSRARLSIGTLRLHLPAGHAERGASVARLVTERLAAALPAAVGSPGTRQRLQLRGPTVAPGASDHELAAAISSAIVAALAGADGGEPHG